MKITVTIYTIFLWVTPYSTGIRRNPPNEQDRNGYRTVEYQYPVQQQSATPQEFMLKSYHPPRQSYQLPLSKESDIQYSPTAFFPYQYGGGMPLSQALSKSMPYASYQSAAPQLPSLPANTPLPAYSPAIPPGAQFSAIHASGALSFPPNGQFSALPAGGPLSAIPVGAPLPAPSPHMNAAAIYNPYLTSPHAHANAAAFSKYPVAGALPYSGQFHNPYGQVPKLTPTISHPRGHQLPTMEEFHMQRNTPPYYSGLPYYRPQQRAQNRGAYPQMHHQVQKPAVKHSGEIYSFNIYNSPNEAQSTPKPQVVQQILQQPPPQQAQIQAPIQIPLANQTEIRVKEVNIKFNNEGLGNQNASQILNSNLTNGNIILTVSNNTNQDIVQQQNPVVVVTENLQQPVNDTNAQVNSQYIAQNINQDLQNVIQENQAPISPNPVFRAFHVRHRTEIPTQLHQLHPTVPNTHHILYNPFLYTSKPEDIALQQAFFPEFAQQLQQAVTSPIPEIVQEASTPSRQEEEPSSDRRELTDDEVEARIRADFDDDTHYKRAREEDDDGELFYQKSKKSYSGEEEEAESSEEY